MKIADMKKLFWPNKQAEAVRTSHIDGVLCLQKVNLLFQACNLTCPMCSMNLNNTEIGQILRDYPGASQGPQLQLHEYKAAFEGVKKHQPVVSIGGGEPTYFPYLVELVEYLKRDLELPVGITTNGTLLNEEKISRLIDLDISLTVSIDGMEETHDSIRGPGTFRTTINAIEKMLQHSKDKDKSAIASLFCVQECNFQEMENIASFLLDEVGVHVLTMSYFIFATPDTLVQHENWRNGRGISEKYKISMVHGGEKALSDFSDFDFDVVFASQLRLQEKYGARINFEPNFESVEDLRKYFLTNEVMSNYFGQVCGPSQSTATLLSNGDLLFYPQCFQIKLGNIRSAGILELWDGTSMREIRETLKGELSPVCAHCCANRIQKVQPYLERLGIGTELTT